MSIENEILINDDFDAADSSLQVGAKGVLPRDFDRVPVGSIVGAPAAAFTLIPRSEWAERIAEMERTKSRLSDLLEREGVPCLNQSQTNYCHSNSPALAIMALRAAQNQPFVLLSPASIGGPVTGFRNEGAYISDALRQIISGGCASQEYVPANQIGQSGFKPGWKENALQHKVEEWWDLGRKDSGMFDRVMTMLLSRIPVCVAYNWWGHAVTLIDAVLLKNGAFGVRFRNSWGADWPNPGASGYSLLQEGKGTPDEAYAPVSIHLAA